MLKVAKVLGTVCLCCLLAAACGDKEKKASLPGSSAENAAQGEAEAAKKPPVASKTPDAVSGELLGDDSGADVRAPTPDVKSAQKKVQLPTILLVDVPDDALKTFIASSSWNKLGELEQDFRRSKSDYLSARGESRFLEHVEECFELRGKLESAVADGNIPLVVELAAKGVEQASAAYSAAMVSAKYALRTGISYQESGLYKEAQQQAHKGNAYNWLAASAGPHKLAFAHVLSVARSMRGTSPSGDKGGLDNEVSRNTEIEPSSAELAKIVADLNENKLDSRYSALRRLSQLGEKAMPIVPDLVKLAQSPRGHVQNFGIDALGRVGKGARSAVSALVELAGAADQYRFSRITTTLGKIGGDEAIRALRDWKDNPTGAQRASAISGLMSSGLPGDALLALYLDIVNDPYDAVRHAAYYGLGELENPTGEKVLNLFRKGLADCSPKNRARALLSLAKQGRALAELEPEVTRLLADPLTRGEATLALASLSPQSPLALGLLRSWLESASTNKHVSALEALGGMGLFAAGTSALVFAAAKKGDAKIRAAAATALASVAFLDPQVEEVLRDLSRDPAIKVRVAAVTALRSLCDLKTATLALLFSLSLEDCAEVRAAAVQTLALRLGSQASGVLAEAMNDPSEAVRDVATEVQGILKAGYTLKDCSQLSIPAEPPFEEPVWSSLDDRIWKVDLFGHEPSIGKKTALVTIVLFTCSGDRAEWSSKVYDRLAKYVEDHPKDVRLVWKPITCGDPKHQWAREHPEPWASAVPTLAAHRLGKFQVYFRELSGDCRILCRDYSLNKAAEKAGLNIKKWERTRKKLEKSGTLDKERELAQRLGISGPNAIYINGRRFGDTRPEINVLGLNALFESELAKARQLVADGVKRKALYGTITKDGHVRECQPPSAPPEPKS